MTDCCGAYCADVCDCLVSVTAHKKAVRALPCVVTGRTEGVTIHHCHGGSMKGIVAPGMGQRASDWLIIPLHIEYHSLDGKGIDANVGVETWEARYGTQVEHLEEVSALLGYDVFKKAGVR